MKIFLQKLREDRGFTLRELEPVAGRDLKTISGWEHGKHNIPDESAQKLAVFFKVTPEELKRPMESEFLHDGAVDYKSSREQKRFLGLQTESLEIMLQDLIGVLPQYKSEDRRALLEHIVQLCRELDWRTIQDERRGAMEMTSEQTGGAEK